MIMPTGVYEHTALKGRKHSAIARANMSKAIKKAYAEGRLVSHWKGKTFSASHRRRMSKSKKKYWETHISPLKGTKIDRAIVDKQAAGRLRYYEDNEAWNKNVRHSKATRKKISEGMRRYWNKRKKLENEVGR
jgi:hypothetical protein